MIDIYDKTIPERVLGRDWCRAVFLAERTADLEEIDETLLNIDPSKLSSFMSMLVIRSSFSIAKFLKNWEAARIKVLEYQKEHEPEWEGIMLGLIEKPAPYQGHPEFLNMMRRHESLRE